MGGQGISQSGPLGPLWESPSTHTSLVCIGKLQLPIGQPRPWKQIVLSHNLVVVFCFPILRSRRLHSPAASLPPPSTTTSRDTYHPLTQQCNQMCHSKTKQCNGRHLLLWSRMIFNVLLYKSDSSLVIWLHGYLRGMSYIYWCCPDQLNLIRSDRLIFQIGIWTI